MVGKAKTVTSAVFVSVLWVAKTADSAVFVSAGWLFPGSTKPVTSAVFAPGHLVIRSMDRTRLNRSMDRTARSEAESELGQDLSEPGS